MSTSTWILLLIVGVAAAAVAAYVLLRRHAGDKSEVYYHFLCPFCNRRLKYKARKAGEPGVCPRCKHSLNFPDTPLELAEQPEDLR